MQRRKYSKEFKQEAVELTRHSGVSVAQVARELGINANMLGRWRREYEEESKPAFRGQGHVRDEEMARLRREPSRVRKERDFLKEAAAFFASESR